MVFFSPLSWALLVLVRKRSEEKESWLKFQENQGMETISMEFMYENYHKPLIVFSHFCFLHNTTSPRRKSACLGKPEA